jgi:hypothetical protein
MVLKRIRRLPPVKALERFFWRTRSLITRNKYRGSTGLRLHLGCGAVRLDGYVNIDADPMASADLYLNIRDVPNFFARQAASEILMIHSVAYLNLWQARDLFREFRSLLAPGGKLILETPDVERCASLLLQAGKAQQLTPDYLEGVRGIFAFDLGQIAARHEFTPYAFAWAGWHLKQELEEAGFTQVRILEAQTHHPWRDVRVEALNP